MWAPYLFICHQQQCTWASFFLSDNLLFFRLLSLVHPIVIKTISSIFSTPLNLGKMYVFFYSGQLQLRNSDLWSFSGHNRAFGIGRKLFGWFSSLYFLGDFRSCKIRVGLCIDHAWSLIHHFITEIKKVRKQLVRGCAFWICLLPHYKPFNLSKLTLNCFYKHDRTDLMIGPTVCIWGCQLIQSKINDLSIDSI